MLSIGGVPICNWKKREKRRGATSTIGKYHKLPQGGYRKKKIGRKYDL